MNSLISDLKKALNASGDKQIAKTFSKEDTLLQISNWIPLKPFIEATTGGKGFPCGHITQIVGKPDSGKTTLMMEGMIACQKVGGAVFLIDTEHKFSLQRYDLMGGNSKELLVLQIDTLEDAWDSIYKVCGTISKFREAGNTNLMMMCWDSVAASVPKRIMEDDAGDAHIAVEAKLNNKNIRKLRSIIRDTDLACVFINHYYMTQPKNRYEQSELVIKGGEEMAFLSTLILKTKQGAKIEREYKGETQKLGRVTRFEVIKGHFHGRTIVKDVFVVDKGILETEEDLQEYKKSLRGML